MILQHDETFPFSHLKWDQRNKIWGEKKREKKNTFNFNNSKIECFIIHKLFFLFYSNQQRNLTEGQLENKLL